MAAPDAWLHPVPYHMAPKRVARTLSRAGHELYCVDMYGDPYRTIGPQPEPPNIPFNNGRWTSIHAEPDTYIDTLMKASDSFKPDLAYVFGWHNSQWITNFFKERKTPLGLHRADPFFFAKGGKVMYPPRHVVESYREAGFFTFNEGQAWNYMRQHGLGDKARLLSHAVDPELAPTREEVVNSEKRYMCSMVMGGEDPYRKLEFLKYYYQWTDLFPSEVFVSGGGTWSAMKWMMDENGNRVPYGSRPYSVEDLNPSDIMHSTKEDVAEFSGRCFNVTKAMDYNCETMPTKVNDTVLCHEFIHRLYRDSFYGFTPYGWYITHGPQSEYQVGPLGTKTTEMGGSGAAMIANWINDVDILIQDGKTGFVFEKPGDAVDAFQYAVDNPGDVRKMGLNAYDFIHKHHSWDVRYREVLLPIFRELGLM